MIVQPLHHPFPMKALLGFLSRRRHVYLWNAWRTKKFHCLHDPIYFNSSIIQAENGTVAMHEESV